MQVTWVPQVLGKLIFFTHNLHVEFILTHVVRSGSEFIIIIFSILNLCAVVLMIT